MCNSFGAGLSSACVVDIGHKMTSIACIDEGVSVPKSRYVIVIVLFTEQSIFEIWWIQHSGSIVLAIKKLHKSLLSLSVL
jgi:hypothetical protein